MMSPDHNIKDLLNKLEVQSKRIHELEKERLEWKGYDKLLRESEDLFKSVVDNSHDGIFMINTAFQVVYVNIELCNIFKRMHLEIIGHDIREFLDEESIKLVESEYLSEINAGRIPGHYEFEIIRKDGDKRLVKLNSAVIQNANSNFLIIGQMLDVTDRKKMEDELLNIKKLESVGLLAGGIAHDFNNILNAILGNISLAKLNLEKQNLLKGLLDEAEKASIRAKGLTNQLLTFSKGGAPVRKTADIENLILESVNLALSGSNIKCRYCIDPDLWSAEVDEGQFHQAMYNLILNAKQAMPNGGFVDVSAGNVLVERGNEIVHLQAGRHIKIAVKDFGIGIPQEHINKIYDPYFTTKNTGQGLGLTSVYSIIKKHEGYILVDSEIDSGTTFTIYLPASDVCNEKTGAEAECFTDKRVRSGLVMVMDDEDMVRNVASRMLEHIGYTVIQTEDGTEAVKYYKKYHACGKKFDFVLIDLTIPGGMGGLDAMRELKKIDPGIKAVISSGYSNDPVMANFKDYGFTEVIAKPFSIDDLEKVINKIV